MKNLIFSLIAIFAAVIFFVIADETKSTLALLGCFASTYTFVYFLNKD